MVQNNYDKVIKDIALLNFVDTRVCKEIINSPFAYLKYMVTDSFEEEGLRLPYVGAFCQKGNYKNKTMRTSTRKKILLENIVDVATMMATTLGFELPTIGSFKDVIDEAFDKGDYEKINLIWDGWIAYNK
jgi:hypothetical protein